MKDIKENDKVSEMEDEKRIKNYDIHYKSEK